MREMLSGTTKLLGIIGHPIGHTSSPRMHNAAFAHDGADYVYVAMDVWPNRLPAAVEGLRALGFVGFNVTMPHKEGILRGLNTDGSGFVEACREVRVSVFGEKVLILGAGGAAAAIAAASLGE